MRNFILIIIFLIISSLSLAAAMPPVICPTSNKLPEVVYLTKTQENLIITLKLCRESETSNKSYIPIQIQAFHNNITQTIEIDRSPDGPDYIGQDVLDRALSFEDINFDGHQDIKMLRWYGAAGNAGYIYWLFNPATSSFITQPNSELLELSNPKLNINTKEVCTSGNAGHDEFYKACYAWKNTHLNKTSEINQSFNRDKQRYIKTTKVFSNGSLLNETSNEIPCSEAMPCK
jgi:hypothetical protein